MICIRITGRCQGPVAFFAICLLPLMTAMVVLSCCSIEVPYRRVTSMPKLDGAESPTRSDNARSLVYAVINVFIYELAHPTDRTFDETAEPHDQALLMMVPVDHASFLEGICPAVADGRTWLQDRTNATGRLRDMNRPSQSL